MSHHVKLFALSTCIHCKNAISYLEECGADFEPVFVDQLEGEERKQTIAAVKEHNPAASFPTMVINGTVVVGYNKDKINEALGK